MTSGAEVLEAGHGHASHIPVEITQSFSLLQGVSDTQVTVKACWPLVFSNLCVVRTHYSGLYCSTVCC